MMLGATIRISKAVAALLRWLGLALGLLRPSWEAAGTAFVLLWRRLLRRASSGNSTPWSELPPELLGLVLSRLSSQADRVRLRAVCCSWRSAPRPKPLPPPFPWIVLRDDTFLTLPNGAPHRLPRHLCCEDIKFRVSAGSVLFLGHSNGGCCLVNPCSGETTNIILAGCSFCKIPLKVVLSDHIVAFLFEGELGCISIALREPRPGARHVAWVPSGNIFDCIIDMALFQGKLYVLTQKSSVGSCPQQQQLDLHLLDISHEQDRLWSVQCISATPINFVPPCSSTIRTHFYCYLVASGDRLLMVERQIDIDVACFPLTLRPIHSWFKVSEALDLIGGHGRWSKVDKLMGHALFVGRQCSDSLPAQCGAQEDCIYFMTERPNFLPWTGREDEADLLGCVVYNVRNRTVEPLTWEKGATRNGPWHPTWLFPTDV